MRLLATLGSSRLVPPLAALLVAVSATCVIVCVPVVVSLWLAPAGRPVACAALALAAAPALTMFRRGAPRLFNRQSAAP